MSLYPPGPYGGGTSIGTTRTEVAAERKSRVCARAPADTRGQRIRLRGAFAARRWALTVREVRGTRGEGGLRTRPGSTPGQERRRRPENRGVQGEDGAVVTTQTLVSDCRGSHPSPAAYSLVTLGRSPFVTPSLSLVTCEVG